MALRMHVVYICSVAFFQHKVSIARSNVASKIATTPVELENREIGKGISDDLSTSVLVFLCIIQ